MLFKWWDLIILVGLVVLLFHCQTNKTMKSLKYFRNVYWVAVWPVMQKIRTWEPASVACGSGFSTLDWIFSCNAISFQNYYWCARFCSNYCTVQVFIIIIEPCVVQYDIYFLLFILQGGTVMIHMIHHTLLKTQCVVQRVHSTSPHHMIKSGSDLNPTDLNMAVVLLLVMSFTRTQVGPALQLIIILSPLKKVYS